jgi:hypothetical protein
MATTRTPISRAGRNKITPTAIAAFKKMQKLELQCTCLPINWDNPKYREECAACDLWWQHHAVLHRELRAHPGDWPCIENPDCEYPDHDPPDPDAVERYRMLEQAAAEGQR